MWLNNKLRTALITLIALVWAVNFTMPLFQRGYKPPAEINLAFMAIVGLLTAGYKNAPEPGTPMPPEHVEVIVPQPAPAKKAPAKKKPVKKPTKKAAKKTVAKKTAAKKTAAKKTAKKQTPRKRGGK